MISEHNRKAFLRGGVAPERLRVIPSGLDTDVYSSGRSHAGVAGGLAGPVRVSVGVRLAAAQGLGRAVARHVATFAVDEGTGLLLKISRVQGQQREAIEQQADEVLRGLGTSLAARPDIVLMDDSLTMLQMAALYRSVGAFVLPSRGEGWGRPLMEAMACGLPTIGTGASGNVDFMTRENSFLVGATLVPVPPAGVHEVPPYAGHQWFEPDAAELGQVLRRVLTRTHRGGMRLAQQGCRDIPRGLTWRRSAGRSKRPWPTWNRGSCTVRRPTRIRRRSASRSRASSSRVTVSPTSTKCWRPGSWRMPSSPCRSIAASTTRPTTTGAPAWPTSRPYFGRTYPDGPDVVIRHAFPPTWDPLPAGKWVHIQPWEYGHLPTDWVAPLVNHVDEIWAPSTYVRDVYVRSGVPAEKIVVIPWGVHPHVFHPEVLPRCLPTAKAFKFLFVGGVIERKGFDTLLSAYLEEFGPAGRRRVGDQGHGCRTPSIAAARCANGCRQHATIPRQAAIMCLDGDFTPGQLSSLYAACDCLVRRTAVKGLVCRFSKRWPAVRCPSCRAAARPTTLSPRGPRICCRARSSETTHTWPLCGPPLELEIEVGTCGASCVEWWSTRSSQTQGTRRRTPCGRPLHLAPHDRHDDRTHSGAGRAAAAPHHQRALDTRRQRSTQTDRRRVPAHRERRTSLAECLARVAPFVDELVVVDAGSTDRSAAVAREYGARVWSLCPMQPSSRPSPPRGCAGSRSRTDSRPTTRSRFDRCWLRSRRPFRN